MNGIHLGRMEPQGSLDAIQCGLIVQKAEMIALGALSPVTDVNGISLLEQDEDTESMEYYNNQLALQIEHERLHAAANLSTNTSISTPTALAGSPAASLLSINTQLYNPYILSSHSSFGLPLELQFQSQLTPFATPILELNPLESPCVFTPNSAYWPCILDNQKTIDDSSLPFPPKSLFIYGDDSYQKIQDTIQSPRNMQDTVSSTNLMQDTMSSKNLMQDTMSSTSLMQDTMSSKNLMQDTISSKNLMQDTISSKNLMQDTISSKNLMQDTISSKSLMQDTISSKSLMQDTFNSTSFIKDSTLSTSMMQDTFNSPDLLTHPTMTQDVIQSTLPTTHSPVFLQDPTRPDRLNLDFSFLDQHPLTTLSHTSPLFPHYSYTTSSYLDSPSAYTDGSYTPSVSPHPSNFPYPENEEKKYPCPYVGCGRSFPRSYNLKSHLLCHSGQKPHICEKCKAAFARKHDLQRHLRTLHSESRPFKCPKCQQGFNKLETLERHLRVDKKGQGEEDVCVKVSLS